MMSIRLVSATCLDIHYHEEHPDRIKEICFQIHFLGRAEWIDWNSYMEFYDALGQEVTPEIGQKGKLELTRRTLRELNPNWQYALEDWEETHGK